MTDDFLDYALAHDFGDIHFKIDKITGMKAIIAIHSTKLGPALGGCRFIEYADSSKAILDAMRLARGMSYKAASVNLPLGGGKAVIIKPSTPFDREQYLHTFGTFIQELGGRYITAVDSGTDLHDMDIIAQHTPYVATLAKEDPSPYTAKTVLKGIEAAVAFKLGKDSLKDLHVAIQGVGHVGYLLAQALHQAGARLTISDTNPHRVAACVEKFGASNVAIDTIHKIPCDIFAPCALGAVINDLTINELQTGIIAGAANNQLQHAYHSEVLRSKGILYAPDYIINAGGLIYAANHYLKTAENELTIQIDQVKEHILAIFEIAEKEKRSPADIADQLAKEKVE